LSPSTGGCADTAVNIEGHSPANPGEELSAAIQTVMPGYFRTLGIPLKSGRDFAQSDDLETAPYRFIVNEAFVRQYLRGGDPIGTKINAIMDSANPFGEIIGVAGNVRDLSIDREPTPTAYYVHSHLTYPSMVFLIRTGRNPFSFAEPVRKVIQRLDPLEPLAEVRTMEDALGQNFSRQRFSGWLLSVFAAVRCSCRHRHLWRSFLFGGSTNM
jgi:putative ABC transport system permease protein